MPLLVEQRTRHCRLSTLVQLPPLPPAVVTDVARAEVSFSGPRGGRVPSFAREAPQPAQAKQPKSKSDKVVEPKRIRLGSAWLALLFGLGSAWLA